jgi:hypothetical protein
VIKEYPINLPREGPNQQVQDLGQLLQVPGITVETEDFSGRYKHQIYIDILMAPESGYNTLGTQVMICLWHSIVPEPATSGKLT